MPSKRCRNSISTPRAHGRCPRHLFQPGGCLLSCWRQSLQRWASVLADFLHLVPRVGCVTLGGSEFLAWLYVRVSSFFFFPPSFFVKVHLVWLLRCGLRGKGVAGRLWPSSGWHTAAFASSPSLPGSPDSVPLGGVWRAHSCPLPGSARSPP